MRRTRGITLAELLVTAVILGVLAPSVLTATRSSSSTARNVQRRAAARTLLVGKLESFRMQCRAGTVSEGAGVSSHNLPGVGPISVQTVVSVTGTLAIVEATATWSDVRPGRQVTDTLQLGTAMRVGN